MAAPKGNTNALKHGLYAKQFNERQRSSLKRMAWDDFRHEEFAHRTVGERIFGLLQELLAQENPDLEAVGKLMNALASNTASINVSARTHAILNGKDEQIQDALSEALGNVPFDEVSDEKT